MARQADDPDVEGEVLAAELRADPGLARRLEQLLLELDVAEGLALLVARRGQPVEVAFAEASLTVFRHASAEVPPMTKARWYGGQAAVPSVFIFSVRNFSRLAGFRSAFVSWKRYVLFAEPPPFAMNRKWYSIPSVA